MVIGESLKINKSLTTLNLGCIHQISNLLCTIVTFSSHILSGNRIDDTGTGQLCEALKSNTTLTRLDLSRERKTD